MTIEHLNSLRDFIRQQNPYFTAGFANLYTDPVSGKIMSENSGVELIGGINDKLGNHFYLRNNPEIRYTLSREQRISSSRSSQDVTFSVWLFAAVKNGVPKMINENLIHTLLSYAADDVSIQPLRSLIVPSAVVRNEYPKLKAKDQADILSKLDQLRLGIVAIEFNFFTIFHPMGTDCRKPPCVSCDAPAESV